MIHPAITEVAEIFNQMQLLRVKLMRDPHDSTAMRLSALMETGKEAMKNTFMEITTDYQAWSKPDKK